jgi:hypothetical protein
VAETNVFELRVVGLSANVRELKRIDRSLGLAISRGLRVFAKELRELTEKKGRALGGVHAETISRKGVKHFARQDAAGLSLDLPKVPFAAGAEFGSFAFRQFPRWRGNQFTDPTGSSVGYMLHPAMREFLPEAEERIADEVEREFKKALDALDV